MRHVNLGLIAIFSGLAMSYAFSDTPLSGFLIGLLTAFIVTVAGDMLINWYERRQQ